MDFLVEMKIELPPDYDTELAADLARRERERATEIATSGEFFKEVWIVPGQRARIMICSAADVATLDATFASLPAVKWCKLEATPLVVCEAGSPICV